MTGNTDKPAADPNKIDAVKLSMMLNELRLPTINQLWQSFAKRADAEGWTAARFLAALVEHELAERGRRRIQRHLGEARLLPGKSLASFDFNAVPTIPADRHRRHYVKATVRVHEYPDGTLAVFHGPRCLARYKAGGEPIDTSTRQAA